MEAKRKGMTTHWVDKFKGYVFEEGDKSVDRYDTFADWWRSCQKPDEMILLLEWVKYKDKGIYYHFAYWFVLCAMRLIKDEESVDVLNIVVRYFLLDATYYEDLEIAWKAAWGDSVEMPVKPTWGIEWTSLWTAIGAVKIATEREGKRAVGEALCADIIRECISADIS